MRTIYKYTIELPEIVGAPSYVDMPDNAEILHIGNQNNEITLWALVNTEERIIPWLFFVFGTGWDLDGNYHKDLLHRGTVGIGPFVWHIFLEKP